MLYGLQHCFEFITDDALVSSISLSGGGGRSQMGSCGAYSSGLIALSLGLSPRSKELSEKEAEELEKVRDSFDEFVSWFIGEYSGVTCPAVMEKLFGRVYHVHDIDKNYEAEERKQLEKRWEEVGFNCALVITKTAIKVAEVLIRDTKYKNIV